MTIDTKHPLYTEYAPDWKQLRDSRSERVVKESGFEYLPATASMVEDGALTMTDPGWAAYCAYRKRARYPEVVPEAVNAMLGVMHNKPASIKLPAQLDYLFERATAQHETLQALLMRINMEQLLMGRVGLLVDVPKSGGLPYLALYQTEDCINWAPMAQEDWPELVVIDESGSVRAEGDPYGWAPQKRYRVLSLVDGIAAAGLGSSDADLAWTPISVMGRTLSRVPFVFVNATDIATDPQESPMLGLSSLALAIYRGEADYRQALYMSGQDTLVVEGRADKSEQQRIGASARIDLPIGGKAYYIGVSGQGVPEMRQALARDYTEANQKANALLEATSRAAESGEALRVRVAARTASLNQVAMTGGYALQLLLRLMAELLGANPEDVQVNPNQDFVADKMPGAELESLMRARELGAPLSLESIHAIEVERGLTELTFEEEMAKVEEERAKEPDGGGARMVDALEDEPAEEPEGGEEAA